MNKAASILVLALFLCLDQYIYCEPTFPDSNNAPNAGADHHVNTLLSELESESRNTANTNDNANYDKRVERYAFGLGRRAYTYTNGNGVKRLPVYNFGLGKRARPYSFGLGKRADYIDDNTENELLDNYDVGLDHFLDEKRNRPYSFGLGKRNPMEDDVERRGYINRYGFGLGR